METARSNDGTRIAFDRIGDGPPLILVGGAFSWRSWKGFVELAELLSSHYTILNYDRRAHGDSEDTPPYTVEREFEDLEAMIGAAGGSAYVWGLSSGGILALEAARAGVAIHRLAVYEPPFIIDPSDGLPPDDFGRRVDELIADERRSEAVKYYMARVMGIPAIVPTLMSLWPPFWSKLKATAHTLPYEAVLVDRYVRGRPLELSLLVRRRDANARRQRREEPRETPQGRKGDRGRLARGRAPRPVGGHPQREDEGSRASPTGLLWPSVSASSASYVLHELRWRSAMETSIR